ncbi:flavodoxin [Actinomyces sp. Chiba101]|uniref:flavodoxin n=1 Tax=Actinomyces TaxID=1654 RepID=UPI000974EDF9|nr:MULTISPECIES: flavodoxin [Actinomyces]BAW92644.1 flavodoxin [Actinomyces sp. Chiba101]GAV94393.1 flavodoxin [Actinomyces denticolens]SUU07856.1 flavodoxin [Actinomyces denticolens]
MTTSSVPVSRPRTLVVHYSAHGHTRRVAETIVRALGADAFVLIPVDVYSEPDLDYNDPRSRVSREHVDRSRRHVELAQGTPAGFADYDVVILGYPLWWGEASWVLNEFVRGNDFTGKTVIPFCTSFSSGVGSSARELAALTSTGDWRPGTRLEAGINVDGVRRWLERLGAEA